ncbi:heme biosynthesis HemY N-terminal domain-containing protein [Marinicellulosiphila megalodicopiae]|uniref:heme biosynthesis HemY N-terminal domain-containing protein n=1 Tax=Marinicellulosiphila megalodicopiae TaxID=2724896 RepID=UPI003BB1ECE6
MKLIIKVILWLLFIGLMAFVGQNMMNTPTHVQIILGSKLIEMSLWVMLVAVLAINLFIYLVVKSASLIRPVETYYRWREKTKTKKSYRFLAEGLYQWFDGKEKTAEKQVLMAKVQQPILSQLMLAYLKHNYQDAIKEVEKVDARFVPFLHWMQLQNLNSHADFMSVLPILREDTLIYKKNAHYLKTAVHIFLNTNQYEHLVGLYSNIEKLLPQNSEALNTQISIGYLTQCQHEPSGSQMLVKRFKNLNTTMQKSSAVLEQYSIIAAKLLEPALGVKIIHSAAKTVLTTKMVNAFHQLPIEAHEKLKQIEIWLQSHQSLSVLHLVAFENCEILDLAAKAQVYIVSYHELEKTIESKMRLMSYYNEKNQSLQALKLLQ